jgi:hypothetical protein
MLSVSYGVGDKSKLRKRRHSPRRQRPKILTMRSLWMTSTCEESCNRLRTALSLQRSASSACSTEQVEIWYRNYVLAHNRGRSLRTLVLTRPPVAQIEPPQSHLLVCPSQLFSYYSTLQQNSCIFCSSIITRAFIRLPHCPAKRSRRRLGSEIRSHTMAKQTTISLHYRHD